MQNSVSRPSTATKQVPVSGDPRSRLREERGAVLVHVAVAFIGLLAFSAFSFDYGAMWVSRRQAQNAADAAALAAAHALAFENSQDWTATGRAKQSANAVAQSHSVWEQVPVLRLVDDNPATPTNVATDDPASDVQIGICPDNVDVCVRVDVVRSDQDGRTNPLPTYFAPLVGINSQDVRATATARIIKGNASDCLRPWAVMDKWEEHVKCTSYQGNNCSAWENNYPNPWTIDDTFDKYLLSGQGGLDPSIPTPTPGYDVYVPPSATDPGTGFQPFNPDGTPGPDYGFLLALKDGSGGNNQISSGWFQPLDFQSICSNPDCPTNQGAQMYSWTITHCVGTTVGIGDTIPIETGNMVGPTDHSVYQHTGQGDLALAEIDPTATWNPTTKTIENSCAPGICADGQYYTQSPRIVPVPLANIDSWLAANPSGSGGSITITNIFGFFIITPAQAATLGFDTGQGNANGTVYGAMVTYPGMTKGTTSVIDTASFLKQIVLIR